MVHVRGEWGRGVLRAARAPPKKKKKPNPKPPAPAGGSPSIAFAFVLYIDRISRSTAFPPLDFKPTRNYEKKMVIPNPCPVWRVLTSFVRQMA
jgi:hypothetical protein